MSWAYKQDKNYCWSEKGKWKWLKPPFHIFFNASCRKHDDLYNKWWNEIDREIADYYFLLYMLEDCKKQPLFLSFFYSVWAYIYYAWVRIGWKESFNYNK